MKDRVESLKRARRFTPGSLFGEAPPTRPPAFSAAPRPARGGLPFGTVNTTAQY